MPLFSAVEVLVLVLALSGASLVLAGVVLVLSARVSRLSRLVNQRGAPAEPSLSASMARSLRDVSEQMVRIETGMADLRGAVRSCIRHVGVVRYDAFRDMGGHMSFSLALLDGRQDGVVLSVLNGRDGSRGYAKAIQGGRSTSPLSEEEQEALSQALDLARVT